MRFVALAAGFDGTLARDGRFDERCLDALRALAATGRKLILVTARDLRELLEIFPQARVFDYVIAENGAVMYQPATRQSEILAQAPSEILLQELARRGIAPLAVGSSIVTTSLANEPEVRDALSKLRLDCQLVANDGALIILPSEVNKASGVKEALRQLGISAHNLAVIGDAENDLALFRLAEHAVAVHNADEATKSCADRTTRGEYCEGFLELARDLTDGDLSYAQPKARVPLGLRNGDEEITLGPYYDSLLVCGPPGSGKAALCNRVLEQLLARGYQCCVVGVNVNDGSTVPIAITIFGDAHEAPRLSEILSALEQPSTSVALNLAALPAESRPVFVDALLVQLQALHDRVGRPHAIVIQQAHWFMTGGSSPMATARLSEMTRIYVTTEPERLPLEILESVSTAIALGDNATMPRQFSGFGVTSRLDVGQPSKLTQNQTPLAQVWIRAQHSQRAVQATAEGAACDIPRSREPDSTSVASTDEVSSFSGY
jgi:HAD superfamily hydrolase (TIGR01484 family)